jgi:hypothetical protein
VAHAGPVGEAATGSQVQVVFTAPVRALTAAGDEAQSPVVMTPNVPGRWQWVGTRAVTFAPAAGRLPEATQFQVEVPSTVRALDGRTLEAAHRFEFSTPRPALFHSSPYDGKSDVLPTDTIELYFNQPIAAEALSKAARLAATGAKGERPLRFEVRHPDPARRKKLEIRPLAPLPLDSQIRLTIAPELRGLIGPLSAGKAQSIEFRTYGPLAVSVECPRLTDDPRCEPEYSPSLSFRNPVKLGDLRGKVQIEPPTPVRFASYYADDDLVSYVELASTFRAGERYTVTVDGSLTDTHGQKLGRTARLSLTMGDYRPLVEVGVQGVVLEALQKKSVEIGSVNVPSFDLLVGALRPEQLVEIEARRHEVSEFEALQKALAGRARTVRPQAAKNTVARQPIDTAALLPSGRGVLGIGVSYVQEQGSEPNRQVKLVQVTDLAITAKVSESGSLVWVTRLSSGAPVPNAEVSVYDVSSRQRSQYRADAQGLATIPAGAIPVGYGEKHALIVASHEGDVSYRRSSDFVPEWQLPVYTDLSNRSRAYGVLFSDRGIYRPGDTVRLKGILRRPAKTGNETPSGQKVKLVVHSPDYEKALERTVTTSRYGTFDLEIPLSRSAALGSWSIGSQESDDVSIHSSFRVAEYRPAEFKVAASSERPSYVRGDKASFGVRGDYLFGAPMRTAGVRYQVGRSEGYYALPNSEGLVTDASVFDADLSERSPESGILASGEAKLDETGTYAVKADLALPGQRSPELVTFDAEVTDVSRQSLGGSTSVFVHPAEHYVGLAWPKDHFVTAPSAVDVSAVTLTPDGRRAAGKKVDVELVRRRFMLVRKQQGSGLESRHEVVDEVVARCQVVTAQDARSCSLTVPEAGYFVVHAKSKDGRGNVARAAYSVYGLGSGGSFWRDQNEQRLELVLDKKEYRVGDTARVLVKNPFKEADAIVTVERADLYESRRLRLKGPTPTFEVPVGDTMRPNAFVSVHLIRPRSAPPAERGKTDVGAPAFRSGYAEILIEPESRRLHVALEPSARDLKPGEFVSVDVRVRDAKKQPHPAEVTLYAVDEGVLSLIDYKTPDPLKVFTAPRPLSVATIESRAELAWLRLDLLDRLGVQKGEEGGGGSEGGDSGVRRDFRQSVYFNPKLEIPPSGQAKVRFQLPESLTTYRIMAVASSLEDRYGFAETQVTTSKRLMARPALPRFLRAGDAFEAGAVVSGKDFGPSKVSVQADMAGLELVGPAEQTVELAKNGTAEVRFAVRAARAGEARIRFSVSAGKERDAVEVVRSVQVPLPLETVALYGQTGTATAERLGDLAALRRDTGGLDVTVASTALVGLDAGVQQLIEYPYGCTEQIASRLLPLLPLRELARDMNIELPKNADAIVARSVADILGRQRYDGGFAMWPESERSSPWVSAYALFVLHESKARGADVPAAALKRGVQYLRSELENESKKPRDLAAEAFLVDVLAVLGAPDSGYMDRLMARRSELPVFAKALLLHALATAKGPEAGQQALVRELENSLHLTDSRAVVVENLGDEYAVLMDSNTRSTALVLRGLLEASPRHTLAASLVRGLLDARRGGTWRTTQETAFALLALDAYRRAQEPEAPSFSVLGWLGETQFLNAKLEGKSALAQAFHVPMGKLGAGDLIFEKQGAGTLFYQARLRYARAALPTEPLDRGFFVQKTQRRVDLGGMRQALETLPATTQRSFSGRDLVITDLVIVSPEPRDYVVVDDPLPAGFEAVDSSLATSVTWLAVPEGGMAGADDGYDAMAHGELLQTPWHRRELRDDRAIIYVDHMPPGVHHFRYLARATTLGRFIVGPTHVEQMYAPEVFGRTAGALVEIR